MIKLLKGLIVGISFTIPGVCSALTAMLLNVYGELLDITERFYKPKVIIKHLLFILGILLGIVISIVVISLLLKEYREYLTIYFFGLAVGGANSLFKKVSLCKLKNITVLILGLILTILPLFIKNSSFSNDNLLMISFSGFISSLAFIMPGISGSMLLLIFGVYDTIIKALYDVLQLLTLDVNYQAIIIVIVFIISFSVGMIFFSKVIKKVLSKYEEIFLIFSLGLLLGTIGVLFIDILNNNTNLLIMFLFSIMGIITIKFLGE